MKDSLFNFLSFNLNPVTDKGICKEILVCFVLDEVMMMVCCEEDGREETGLFVEEERGAKEWGTREVERHLKLNVSFEVDWRRVMRLDERGDEEVMGLFFRMGEEGRDEVESLRRGLTAILNDDAEGLCREVFHFPNLLVKDTFFSRDKVACLYFAPEDEGERGEGQEGLFVQVVNMFERREEGSFLCGGVETVNLEIMIENVRRRRIQVPICLMDFVNERKAGFMEKGIGGKGRRMDSILEELF